MHEEPERQTPKFEPFTKSLRSFSALYGYHCLLLARTDIYRLFYSLESPGLVTIAFVISFIESRGEWQPLYASERYVQLRYVLVMELSDLSYV